jgi:nitrogen-specific signal transduction histidine kinase/DNA-binding NarL/FixJ family response regulator
MKALLLITDTTRQLTPLYELLAASYTVFTATSHDEALEYLRLTRVDAAIVACDVPGHPVVACLEQAKALQPHCATLYLAAPLPADAVAAEHAIPPCDAFMKRPFKAQELHRAIEQALEKQRLVEEIAALRQQEAVVPPPSPSGNGSDLSLARIGQILRHFAKAFSTNYDMQQTLHLFLDAISEFLHPSRASIMVRNTTTRLYEIRAYRGMVPQVAEHLRLRPDEGVPQWLIIEGRLLHRGEVEKHLRTPGYLDIHREMQALKALVSIPLMASGSLVGILNLGERITGAPYTDDELEILFSLGSHVAVAIQDIALYHAAQAQKAFTEKILRYMSSGVLSIGSDQKISLCNHRAAEILGKAWTDMLQQDLRFLPSPLGDILYETLQDGTTYLRQEVALASGKMPLEVSTYRVFDECGSVAGSVMVFEDLTSQRLLYEERRRGDQLDFLNKVVGRMAHEIKNPLVSIQTFVELLADHYDDPEFRDHFRTIVSRDVYAVDSITEKLVSFASKISYHFEYVDVSQTLRQFATTLVPTPATVAVGQYMAHDAGESSTGETACIECLTTEPTPPVKLDPEQFHKALMYLVAFLRQGMEHAGKVLVSSHYGFPGRRAEAGEWVSIILTGKGRKLSPEEFQQLFDPFCMEQSTIIDVGPCVSQKIIEEHGGHLDVQQEKAGDTSFVIALPVAR